MDPHERAVSCWYRIAGLVSRNQKELAVEIIEAEIRSAQHEVILEAARLVLTGEPIEIARHLRDREDDTATGNGPTFTVSWANGLSAVEVGRVGRARATR